MTTVVYRDGVMASDSQYVENDVIMPGHHPKVFRLPGGGIMGYCGLVEVAYQVLNLIKENKPLATLDEFNSADTTILVVHENGKISYTNGREWTPIKVPYIAIGSGSPMAYGALALGASARQAVKAAMKHDTTSGGRLQAITMELDLWTGERSYVSVEKEQR